jgi:hypothetical protein
MSLPAGTKSSASEPPVRGLAERCPAHSRGLAVSTRHGRVVALAVALWVGVAAPAGAQSMEELLRSLRKEIEALKEGQASMRREIEEIKDALRARDAREAPPPAPQNIALSLDGAPVKGDGKARLVLIDFTDYQ